MHRRSGGRGLFRLQAERDPGTSIRGRRRPLPAPTARLSIARLRRPKQSSVKRRRCRAPPTSLNVSGRQPIGPRRRREPKFLAPGPAAPCNAPPRPSSLRAAVRSAPPSTPPPAVAERRRPRPLRRRLPIRRHQQRRLTIGRRFETPRRTEPPAKVFEELVVSPNSVIGLQTETRLSSETARDRGSRRGQGVARCQGGRRDCDPRRIARDRLGHSSRARGQIQGARAARHPLHHARPRRRHTHADEHRNDLSRR